MSPPVLALLLAAVPCLAAPAGKEKTAERDFKKIEQALRGARTVRVSFRTAAVAPAKRGKAPVPEQVGSGTLLLKGNKVKLTLRAKEKRSLLLVSDGKRALGNKDGGGWREEQLPKLLGAGFAVALARSGVFLWARAILPLAGEDIKKEADLDKVLRVSHFKAGKDEKVMVGKAGREKEARTITYRLTVNAPVTEGGARDVWEGKVWYEPKTSRLLKRTLSKKGAFVFTETYDVCELGGSIPDEEFKLPGDK
jgi:hypothetical protein